MKRLLFASIAALFSLHCSSGSGTTETPAPAATTPEAPPAAPPAPPAPAPVTPPPANDGIAAMTKARSLAALVRGADGRVHVFGGLGGAGLDDSHESYDATANKWTMGTAKSSVRRYALTGALASSGDIYLLGGTLDGSSPIGLAEVYSPKDDTFTKIDDMPTPRLGLAAAAGKDGKLYAIGGRDDTGTPTDVVEVFSPDTKTWSKGPSMPTKRLTLAAVSAPDGKIYAIAGRDAKTTPLDVVEALDVDTGTWSTVAPLAQARYWLGATVGADGRIVVAGGIGGLTAADFVDSAEAFTPGAGWTTLPKMPEARAWASMATLPDGRLLLAGGSNNEDVGTIQPPPLKTSLAFDPKKNTWTH